ncbi:MULTISPECIES: hypothetical protein [unclassified Bradyrhizobium]
MDDIWMTAAARFVPLNVARQRCRAALRRKIAGRFREHLAAKKKRCRRIAAVKVNCNPRRAGSQEGKG